MKLVKILSISALALAAVFFACKQDSKKPTASTPETAPALPPAKPEVVLYITTVDKLNLREEPIKNGKVITQLAENAYLEGTGEVSANREEATLRGLTWNEPYLKVATAAPEPRVGWAYGGALQRVYAGARSNIPDLDKLSQLTSFLKTLNAKKLESGKKTWDFVNTNFSGASGPLADAAFVLFEGFLRRMEIEGEFYKMTEKVTWVVEDYEAIANHTFDMNKYPESKSLAENGFELAQGEGMVFPTADWDKLQLFFGSKVTPAMKAYLDQQTAEQNNQAWDDGGIIISLEELADRAAFWEKFNRENPYFLLTEETTQSEQWTRLVLVNGADNTPTYNYDTQEIAEDYKKVWAYIQQKYPGTELAKNAKEIADLCAAEGWKRTKKVEEWQTNFANKN